LSPIVATVLGAGITAGYSGRWIFFINLMRQSLETAKPALNRARISQALADQITDDGHHSHGGDPRGSSAPGYAFLYLHEQLNQVRLAAAIYGSAAAGAIANSRSLEGLSEART
jgi:hypothetical protein